jgi:ribosome-binding protein aMBF1 (putative translation factor)
MKKKTNVDLHKERLLQNPEFKQAYHELGPVYKLIREIVAFRIAQGMTQKELAEKIGTKQSSISRFEKAMKLPSISFLSQITEALGLEWEFTIHPKSL